VRLGSAGTIATFARLAGIIPALPAKTVRHFMSTVQSAKTARTSALTSNTSMTCMSRRKSENMMSGKTGKTKRTNKYTGNERVWGERIWSPQYRRAQPKEDDMGYLQTPPNDPQLAAAQDYMFALLEAVKLAQAAIISRNLKLTGTISEQEAFALTWSEIRGVAARALATGTSEDARQAKVAVNREVEQRILSNPAYDKFKIGMAGSDDPLMS